jgi:hypothetical protein
MIEKTRRYTDRDNCPLTMKPIDFSNKCTKCMYYWAGATNLMQDNARSIYCLCKEGTGRLEKNAQPSFSGGENTQRAIALLLRHPSFAIGIVSRFMPFSRKTMSEALDYTYLYPLAENNQAKWSVDNLERVMSAYNKSAGPEYGDIQCRLARNIGVPWTTEWVESLSSHFDYLDLCYNELFPWTAELIEKHLLNNGTGTHRTAGEWWGMSKNTRLPWSTSFINRFIKEWDWDTLSRNPSLPWSESLVFEFDGYWDWKSLSLNEGIPWSNGFIEENMDKLDWEGLSGNQSLPWTADFVENHVDDWSWSFLSGNPGLPWSLEFFEKHIDRWNWSSLSENPALPWSLEFFERHTDKWDWPSLSRNPALPWSREFFVKYLDNWNRLMVTANPGLPWSSDFFEKYFSWTPYPSSNPDSLPASLDFFPWSLDFLEEHETAIFDEDSLSPVALSGNRQVWQSCFSNHVTESNVVALLKFADEESERLYKRRREFEKDRASIRRMRNAEHGSFFAGFSGDEADSVYWNCE